LGLEIVGNRGASDFLSVTLAVPLQSHSISKVRADRELVAFPVGVLLGAVELSAAGPSVGPVGRQPSTVDFSGRAATRAPPSELLFFGVLAWLLLSGFRNSGCRVCSNT
jgi:hypothetical protein